MLRTPLTAAVSVLFFHALCFADTQATWTAAGSGTWEIGTNWSTNPYYPNNGNPAGTNYNATIATPGTVTLSSAIALDGLSLSNGATLNLKGSIDAATINASTGTLLLDGGTLSNANISGNFKLGDAGSAYVYPALLSTVANSTLSTSFTVPQYANLTLNNVTMNKSSITATGGGADSVPSSEIFLSGVLGGTGTLNVGGSAYGNGLVGGGTTGPGITINILSGGGLQGGTLTSNGTFLVYKGYDDNRNGSPAILQNNGTFIIDASYANVHPANAIYANGIESITAGYWRIQNGASLEINSSFFAPSPVLNGSTFVIDGASSAVPPFRQLFENDGTLSLLNGNHLTSNTGTFLNAGFLRLGTGSEFLDAGSFSQSATGSLQFDLAGSTTSAYGRVAVPGAVFLNGSLTVTLANYDPALGSIFTLISGGSISGNFSNIYLPALSNGKYFQLVGTPTTVYLAVVPEPTVVAGAATLFLLGRRRNARPRE